MDWQAVLKEFVGGASLRKLSNDHLVEKAKIRSYLVNKLGHECYLKTIHSNGGKAVAQRLAEPSYRARYVKKMQLSVRETLNAKMRNRSFKTAWLAKARRGSIRGIENLRNLMKELKFHEDWVDKCRIAGRTSYLKRAGIHKASPSARRRWSICGLKNTGKKLAGPYGEKMYNKLEVSVAQILDSLGLRYEYEKILTAKNKNGFVSIDFVLPNVPDLFIEVTYWSDAKEKMVEMKRKWDLIKTNHPNAKLIVVTRPGRMEEYSTLSQTDINVFTPIMLKRYLTDAKLAG